MTPEDEYRVASLEDHVAALTEALQNNLELVQTLSHRLALLEKPVEDNAARQIAVMLLLRAAVQCSPERTEILAMAERMAAQIQAQPGVILHGAKESFLRMKTHLDWMTDPPKSLG